jgi:para-nitrobenzyl esterase
LKLIFRLLLSLLVLSTVLVEWANAKAPRVVIEQGVLEGRFNSNDTSIFMGVPYAAPPIGLLRFRAPQPPSAFQGVYQALKPGPQAIQENPITGRVVGSLDSLYLNVWAPKNPTGQKLPVMVWIHGGAFVFGSGNQRMGLIDVYDAAALAEKGEVIVVSANYRLGAESDFAHPTLAALDPNGSTGNNGHLDQIAVLKWIQQNIHAFGGDPGKVTIFGESAGGASVLALLASPLARGLFHRAISQSGLFFDMPLGKAFAQSNRMIRHFGLNPDNFSLKKMQQTSEHRLAKDFSLLTKLGEPRNDFGPIVDGGFLHRPVLETILAGEHNAVPVLIGTNADEMKVLGPIFLRGFPNPIPDELYHGFINEMIGEEQTKAALKHYNKEKYGTNRDAMMALFADGKFHSAASQIAKALSTTSHPQGVFRYLFNRTFPAPLMKIFGAGHGFDVFSLFPNRAVLATMSYDPFKPWKALGEYQRQVAFSDRLIEMWSNFAHYGNPNGPTGLKAGVVWPDAKSGRFLEMTNEGEVVRTNGHFDQLSKFKSGERKMWNTQIPTPGRVARICIKAQSVSWPF